MTFTDTQLELLKEAEPHFNTARKGFIRYASRDLSDKVADIYFEATGQKIPKTWSCSICVLNLYRKVGYFYYKDLEEKQKEAERIKASEGLETNAAEEDTLKKSKKPVANKKKKDG